MQIIKHVKTAGQAAIDKNLNVNTDLVKEQTEQEVKIEQLIREKYSLSQEVAMLRKVHLGKITEDEFKEYSDYIEECIKKVEEENPQPEGE